MLLKEFVVQSAIFEARNYIRDNLIENVNDYLSLTLAKLNNKKPEDTAKGKPDYIDLGHLAVIVTGLKILANPDYRTGLTKQDVGINPNDAKELFAVLNKVDKDGKDPEDVLNVFIALCKLAPAAAKKQRAELEIFQTGDDAERKHAAQELQRLIIKVGQMFNKLRASSTTTRGVDIPSLGEI
jgi:hypothetical protein